MEEMISFEDFKRINLRIGTIIKAERIPESTKLLKLEIDFGNETRQIMAGIGASFEDLNDLTGQQIPVVVNLEPKTFLGYESQGMILATDGGAGPILLNPVTPVPAGSKIR